MPTTIVSPEAAANQLQQLWRLHVAQYEALNPRPQQPATAITGLHWTVLLMLGTAIALGIGVSFRTAAAFYAAAAASNSTVLGMTEALLFTLGVEGSIATLGSRHAYRAALEGKTERGMYRAFLQTAQVVGLVILVLISALAGQWQAYAISNTLASERANVLQALAVMMGSGASIAVFLLFEATGAEAARGIVLAEHRRQEYEVALAQWRDAMTAEFDGQPGVIRLRQLAFGQNAARGLPTHDIDNQAEYQQPVQMTTISRGRDPVKLRKTLQYIADTYRPGDDVHESRRAVANALDVSLGLVQDAVNMWRANPQAVLDYLAGNDGNNGNGNHNGE